MNDPDRSSIARKALRSALLERREGIAVTDRRAHDAALIERLAEWVARSPGLDGAGTIAVYAPIRSEPDLMPLYRRWWREGRTLALPMVTGRDRPLSFARYQADTALTIARFDVAVPRDPVLVEPDALVMPCVGFRRHDGRLWRLGYGAGFYDRTLAQRPVIAVGVAYDESETTGFEPASFDAPLAAVITPSRTIDSIASP